MILTNYDSSLVLLSILIAVLTSYTALGLGHRVITSESSAIKLWVMGGALTMGIGIWSMHFIGMLAFKMSMPIAYDPLISLFSIVPAIIASSIALITLSTRKLNPLYSILAALLMGAGISSMHYMGMAAMQMEPAIQYNPLLFTASVIIAVSASGASLLIIFNLQRVEQSKLRWRKFYSSVLMGLAISGMHYTGMAAATFPPDSISLAAPSGISTTTLAILVTGSAILVLIIAIAVMVVDNLRGQNRFYSTLLAAQSDVGEGVLLVQDMKIIFSNPAMGKITNHKKVDLLELNSPLSLFPIEDRDKVEHFLLHSQNNIGTTSRHESGLLTSDGSRLECEIAISSFEQGEKIRTLIVCLDITDRVRALENLRDFNETLEKSVTDRTHELQEQQQFIETILDIAGALVVVLDREGRIVRFNHACETLTSRSIDQVRGKIFWNQFLPKERVEYSKKIFQQLITSGEPLNHESRWLTADKQERLISWSSASIKDKDGIPQYVTTCGIDITEQKISEQALIQANEHLHDTILSLNQTQDQLVQAEKMASLGSLVAGISHEINTPIGIAVTSATNLEEELAKLSGTFLDGSMKRSSLEKFLSHSTQVNNILLQNIRRASELISSFKQVAVDQSSDAWRSLDLKQYIDEVIQSLAPKLRHTSIQVINDFQADTKIYIHPGAIYQALSNLILNALTHAFEKSQEGSISITGEVGAHECVLSVADNGNGIPAENRKSIFDPFFTTQRGSGGSGLGLHIAYNLITSTLKGHIALDPEHSPGSKFRIDFPLTTEEKI